MDLSLRRCSGELLRPYGTNGGRGLGKGGERGNQVLGGRLGVLCVQRCVRRRRHPIVGCVLHSDALEFGCGGSLLLSGPAHREGQAH